ncbi:hypothetical protein KC19_1G065400 [Ceratodon purpureus]|uniref:Uncharacterized protein n=1 Tax=Ceratodon purpureus TaxID=3225 RepID=A0A8T0J389_CERPU|nr:hypothetical protein KC19_1G065400 [Ceratodon purpureus]
MSFWMEYIECRVELARESVFASERVDSLLCESERSEGSAIQRKESFCGNMDLMFNSYSVIYVQMCSSHCVGVLQNGSIFFLK